MPTDTRPSRVVLFTVLATILWPLQEAAGGMLMRSGHHAAQVVALRYMTHLSVLFVLVAPTRGMRAFSTRRPALQLIRGLCMFGMPVGFIMAVDQARTSWIWTIFWLMPAVALAGAVLLMRERPPLAAWVAVAIAAIAGAAIMDPLPGGVPGTFWAFVMGGSFAGYVVLSRMLRDESLSASLLYTAVGALAPMALVVWKVWTPLTMTDIVAAIVTGLLSIGVLACFDLATEAGPVWMVAPLIPLVLIWESLLRVVLYGGALFTLDYVGIGLVVAAVALSLRRGPVMHTRTRTLRSAPAELDNG